MPERLLTLPWPRDSDACLLHGAWGSVREEGRPFCPGAAGATSGKGPRSWRTPRGVHGHQRSNRQGFSKGLAARWSSYFLGPRATREAEPAPALGSLPSPPQPRPSAAGPSRSGRPAGSDHAPGCNASPPGTQLRLSREQKRLPAPELPKGWRVGSPAPAMGHPQRVPPNFHLSCPFGGGVGAVGQGAERAQSL